MSLPRIPQTRVIKKLGLSTVVAWDLSNCISVEEGAAIDVSDRKVLPTHIKGASDVAATVALPNPALHKGRAITVKAGGTTGTVDIDGTSISVAVANGSVVVYSDGSAWVAF